MSDLRRFLPADQLPEGQLAGRLLRHVRLAPGGRADHRVHEPDHARQRHRKSREVGSKLEILQETSSSGSS